MATATATARGTTRALALQQRRPPPPLQLPSSPSSSTALGSSPRHRRSQLLHSHSSKQPTTAETAQQHPKGLGQALGQDQGRRAAAMHAAALRPQSQCPTPCSSRTRHPRSATPPATSATWGLATPHAPGRQQGQGEGQAEACPPSAPCRLPLASARPPLQPGRASAGRLQVTGMARRQATAAGVRRAAASAAAWST